MNARKAGANDGTQGGVHHGEEIHQDDCGGGRCGDACSAGRVRWRKRRRRQDHAVVLLEQFAGQVPADHDAFEKANPDIKIDYSTTTGSQSGYQQTLQTRISGGNLADVYIVPPEALSDLVKGNYAKDLSNESFMDKIGDAAKKAYSVDGKVYAMGVSTWTNAWVYNKDLLKKVGYDSIPATWDEFLTMCGKLKAAGNHPIP